MSHDLVDDHSRLLFTADAFRTVKGGDVVRTFFAAAQANGGSGRDVVTGVHDVEGGQWRARQELSPWMP